MNKDTAAEATLTVGEVVALKNEFISNLPPTFAMSKHQPFIIVVGGAPGFGKTTTAELIAYLSLSQHVQSNSARELLRRAGLPWGKNVRQVIECVIEEFMTLRMSVVLDGMMLKEEERELVSNIGAAHGAKVFFTAVTCDPKIAERRARTRYSDGRPSTFQDWRCDPNRFDDYIRSMYERGEILNQMLKGSTAKQYDIVKLYTDASVEHLKLQVENTWRDIEKKLQPRRGH